MEPQIGDEITINFEIMVVHNGFIRIANKFISGNYKKETFYKIAEEKQYNEGDIVPIKFKVSNIIMRDDKRYRIRLDNTVQHLNILYAAFLELFNS